MIVVMSNLRRLADVTGAAVIVIHHQRKSNGFKGRAGDTLRGHSCIEAALDLALLVERDEQASDRIKIKSTKTRNVDVMPFNAMFAYEHKPNSYELAEARFFGIEPERDDKLLALEAAILNAVKSNPGCSQRRLTQSVKQPDFSDRAIRHGISTLVEAGKLRVVQAENGKSSAYYPNNDYVEF